MPRRAAPRTAALRPAGCQQLQSGATGPACSHEREVLLTNSSARSEALFVTASWDEWLTIAIIVSQQNFTASTGQTLDCDENCDETKTARIHAHPRKTFKRPPPAAGERDARHGDLHSLRGPGLQVNEGGGGTGRSTPPASRPKARPPGPRPCRGARGPSARSRSGRRR